MSEEDLNGAQGSTVFEQVGVAKQWRLCIMKHRRHYASSRTMHLRIDFPSYYKSSAATSEA